MTLMLTNKCKTNCKYCYADKSCKYNELSTDQILEIIEQAQTAQLQSVDIIGGEVFLKKDWEIIVGELVQHGVAPSYISTKIPITEDIAKKLHETGFNGVVQLSIDSLNETDLNNIIGCGDGYISKVIEGIGILQKYRFCIQINTIITKYTKQSDLLDLLALAESIENLKYWEIRTPKPSLYNTDTYNEIKTEAAKARELYSFIRHEIIPNTNCPIEISMDPLTEKYNCHATTSESFDGEICPALKGSFFVLPDGRVTICEELYTMPRFIIGDLKKQTLTEIWNSQAALELYYHLERTDFGGSSACRRCGSFESCMSSHKRCWVKVIGAYGFENWDFPDPRCESAPSLPNGILY